jgi:hypothetical protein
MLISVPKGSGNREAHQTPCLSFAPLGYIDDALDVALARTVLRLGVGGKDFDPILVRSGQGYCSSACDWPSVRMGMAYLIRAH